MAFDLECLYRTTYDAVVRFLYRKVWDADRAEDLAQEVFMRALAHQPEKPRSWVFAVAANIARDEARAAIRRRKHLVLLTHEPIAAPAPGPGAPPPPAHNGRAYWIKVSARSDGSFTVTNGRNQFTKTYAAISGK